MKVDSHQEDSTLSEPSFSDLPIPTEKQVHYGKGHQEPLLDGYCVVCNSTAWYLCVSEYSEDSAVKKLIRENVILEHSHSYHRRAHQLMCTARAKKQRAP